MLKLKNQPAPPPPPAEELPSIDDYDIMDLFDELSFSEKWKRVKEGLKQPPDSGEYKWAKLQMLRLWSPITAVVAPCIMVLLLMIFASISPAPTTEMQVSIMEPEIPEELEPPEPIIDEPPDPPDPVEIETESVAPGPASTSTDSVGPDADFSPQPTEFDSVAMVKSPITFSGIYASRNPGHRGSIFGKRGGPGGGSEEAVLRALRWLKKHQNSDGSWTSTSGGGGEVTWGAGPIASGMTGLGLLTFLAHGETPASEEFGVTVEGAIRYLMGNQKEDGRFKSVDNHEYCHPIAAYALCEAYGMTKIPMIKEHADKAINVVIAGQHGSGGWDYNLQASSRDDTSFAAWCAQALKAAKMAGLEPAGLNEAMQKAVASLKANANPDGSFAYTNSERDAHKPLVSAGILCLQLLGSGKDKESTAGMRWWDQNQSSNWASPKDRNPVYYWYYITQAKFHEGGTVWDGWNNTFIPQVIKAQTVIHKEDSGYTDHKGTARAIGYWVNPSGSEYGGPSYVYNTTLCTLMLEVYYRYLPTFKGEDQAQAQEIVADDEIQVEIR